MKKVSSLDVVGTFILSVVIVTIIGLFIFAGNGTWIATFGF